MDYVRLTGFIFSFVFFGISVPVAVGQEAFHGGPVDKRLLPREYRQERYQNDLPSYMPRHDPSWQGMRVRGKYVKKYDTPMGNVGYSIGRPPSKSISKQFQPKRRSRSAGFGSVGMF